ncbi:hypothetical protein [Citricoccus nitrophenolicus]|uniref:hypothetical protein n=1 Tax=Citricoccus nitrophenolicus TaxID=863575 RepID=UPI0039B64285
MANSRSGESLIQRLVRVLHAFDAGHPELTASELAAAYQAVQRAWRTSSSGVVAHLQTVIY